VLARLPPSQVVEPPPLLMARRATRGEATSEEQSLSYACRTVDLVEAFRGPAILPSSACENGPPVAVSSSAARLGHSYRRLARAVLPTSDRYLCSRPGTPHWRNRADGDAHDRGCGRPDRREKSAPPQNLRADQLPCSRALRSNA